ncbi:MAG: MnhB domain-containing protein [Candidatus Accumulibacter sp.]|uniref:MnhB domain-containing protein n=1 Tax=Accumulibacter sp. TaxID=2053492 RepID=UPI0028790D5E|nr:MnhB domain-containing protein [Accumulibacter sp.]MDS4013584.1 MnhB domain-containing protein [Accumulibacter sp.]
MKRLVTLSAAAIFAALLIDVLLDLPAAALDLRALLAEAMPASGVAHPVTAVLLNTRGYDTLLEIAVLLVALLGVVISSARTNLSSDPGRTPASHVAIDADPMVSALARLVTPLAVIFAIYVLWAGAHRPGGAFQAAAILAAALVLLHFARIVPACTAPSCRLRVAAVAGFAIFLVIAAIPLAGGALLQYPPAAAGLLILAIESGLTVSLALVLAGLFLLLADDAGGRQ